MNMPKKIIDAALGTNGLIGLSLGMTALRIATRSVPSAMLIGTGLVLAAHIRKKQADKQANKEAGGPENERDPSSDARQ